MQYKIVENRDVSYLDNILLSEDGYLKPVNAETLLSIDLIDRQIWAVKNAVYQFVTKEMITFLKAIIGERTAIEICAGNGGIGRTLSIPATDDFQQQTPELNFYYRLNGIVPTHPPDDVIKMEACDAIRHFKPQVVVGGYVTQLYKEGDVPGISSVLGVDEEWILENAQCYVIFGNLNSHDHKRIFKKDHVELHFPWHVTRSSDQENNRIWIWDNKKIQL